MTVAIAPGKRVPGTYIVVDPSRATRGQTRKDFRAVLIGGKTTAGTLTQKVKQLVTSADQVRGFAGAGSPLHRMAIRWFQQTIRPLSVDIVALDESGSGAAATLTLTFAASSSQAGTVPLLIGGVSVRVGVAAGDSASTIAAAARAAVNATEGVAVVASGSAADLILTALYKGAEGNSIDVRVAYFSDEVMPTGVTVTGGSVLAGGATNPTLDAATFLALGEVQYDVLACSFADATNLGALHVELASRFSQDRQIQGSAIVGKRDTLANLVTFGTGKNSPHITCVGVRALPSPPEEVAAAVAAVAGGTAQADPAVPIQRIELVGILPPSEVDQFTPAEREILLHSGIATTKVGAGGVLQIERCITFYRLSPAGAVDVAFLDVETMFTCSLVRWGWKTRTELLHPQAKLANDGTRFGGGSGDIVTPMIRKAEWAAYYRELEAAGILEGFEAAMRDSTFTRDPDDPNRLNEILAPDFVNQARIFAVVLQFRL